MLNWKKNDVKQATVGILFLLPNILGFLVFTAIPLVISLFMAFTDWNLEMRNMFQDATVKSVGFGNFVKLFTDPDFFTYLGNTLFLMIGIPFGVAGSLAAAMLLNVKEHKRTLEELAERAVRFGEDCYVEGIIPIQKVKRLAAFYLQEEAPEKMEQAQAMQQIEECLQKNTEEEVKEKTEEK